MEKLEKELLQIMKGESNNTSELEDIENMIGFEVQSSIMTTYGFEAPKEAVAETGGDGLLNEIQGQVNTAALIVSLSCKSIVPPHNGKC